MTDWSDWSGCYYVECKTKGQSMTTNHSDQGFISNRGASDRLFPAHLLTSFNHHRMLGSNKPEDDFVTRVKTIPLKSWQTASQHRTSRGNLCPGCQYRRIGLRRSFCRPPTDHHLQSATAISVGLWGCKSLVQDSPKLTMRTWFFSGIKLSSHFYLYIKVWVQFKVCLYLRVRSNTTYYYTRL